MATFRAPLTFHAENGDVSTVVDPRFGTDETPTQPAGWGGGGTAYPDTEEIWVDTDYAGATDASADINAAIIAADLNVTLGFATTVRLKPGVLRLTAPIEIRRRTRLVGSGMKNTILRPYGPITAISKNSAYSQPLDDVTIADLEVDGSNQTASGFGSIPKGLYFLGARRITLRNLYVHDTWATGVGVDNVTGVYVNVWAVGCGRQIRALGLPVGTTPGCSGIGIGVGDAPGAAGWEPLTIVGCHTSGNGNYGIFLETQSRTQVAQAITITGCTAKGNGRAGIGDAGATGTIITGNHVSENREGIALDLGTMGGAKPGRRTLIHSNMITDNQIGIRMVAAEGQILDGVSAKDNTVIGSTQDAVLIELGGTGAHRDVWVEGNYIAGASGAGVKTVGDNNIDRLAVTGNRIRGAGGPAVSIGAPTTKARVTGNEAWGNGAGIFFDTTRTHTGHVIDSAWVEGDDTLPV